MSTAEGSTAGAEDLDPCDDNLGEALVWDRALCGLPGDAWGNLSADTRESGSAVAEVVHAEFDPHGADRPDVLVTACSDAGVRFRDETRPLTRSAQAGEALAGHPAVKRVAFTGSSETGRAIQRSAAGVAVKALALRPGGENALIMLPDADRSAGCRCRTRTTTRLSKGSPRGQRRQSSAPGRGGVRRWADELVDSAAEGPAAHRHA